MIILLGIAVRGRFRGRRDVQRVGRGRSVSDDGGMLRYWLNRAEKSCKNAHYARSQGSDS